MYIFKNRPCGAFQLISAPLRRPAMAALVCIGSYIQVRMYRLFGTDLYASLSVQLCMYRLARTGSQVQIWIYRLICADLRAQACAYLLVFSDKPVALLGSGLNINDTVMSRKRLNRHSLSQLLAGGSASGSAAVALERNSKSKLKSNRSRNSTLISIGISIEIIIEKCCAIRIELPVENLTDIASGAPTAKASLNCIGNSV